MKALSWRLYSTNLRYSSHLPLPSDVVNSFSNSCDLQLSHQLVFVDFRRSHSLSERVPIAGGPESTDEILALGEMSGPEICLNCDYSFPRLFSFESPSGLPYPPLLLSGELDYDDPTWFVTGESCTEMNYDSPTMLFTQECRGKMAYDPESPLGGPYSPLVLTGEVDYALWVMEEMEEPSAGLDYDPTWLVNEEMEQSSDGLDCDSTWLVNEEMEESSGGLDCDPTRLVMERSFNEMDYDLDYDPTRLITEDLFDEIDSNSNCKCRVCRSI